MIWLWSCVYLWVVHQQQSTTIKFDVLKFWAFYIFILLLGSFLYLSIIFSYFLLAPLHILVIWLMYNRLLSDATNDVVIRKNIFLLIPCILQNILLLIYFISTNEFTASTIYDLYVSWIGLVLIIVTCLEFFVLRRVYVKRIENNKRSMLVSRTRRTNNWLTNGN